MSLRPSVHKDREFLGSLRVPDGTWVVIRVDGKGFSSYTAKYERPFDARFHKTMVFAARAQFRAFENTPALVTTHSDEISVVLPPSFDLFQRRVEKLVSVAASMAASAFGSNSGDIVGFDARLVVEPSLEAVVDYLQWRHEDCWRCFLNSLAYWTARDKGLSKREATRIAGALPREKHDYLHSVGINPVERPVRERRGSVVYRKREPHTGHNPLTGKDVETTRMRVTDEAPPHGQEFRDFVAKVLEGSHG